MRLDTNLNCQIPIGIKLYHRKRQEKIGRFPKLLHPLKEKYKRLGTILQDSTRIILVHRDQQAYALIQTLSQTIAFDTHTKPSVR